MTSWRKSAPVMLVCIAVAGPLAHTTWRVLLNNFAVEWLGTDGAQIGAIQSVREIPGLLAVSILLPLLVLSEQRLLVLALGCLGIGVMATGFVSSLTELFVATLVMSVGFHYAETLETSLTLQLMPKEKVHSMLGSMVSASSVASIVMFLIITLLLYFGELNYTGLYIVGGASTFFMAMFIGGVFPKFSAEHKQRQHVVLRKRYGLFYVLTLLSGARRQIFVVFAAFLMVERYRLTATQMALLFLVSQILTIFIAPYVGRFVKKVGERTALILEHSGLILVFCSYAFVTHTGVAVGLYLLDNLFFTLAIALKSYFKRIADPADIAATSGVSSTINHIAAVWIPVSLGFVWLSSPGLVFLIGAGLAGLSLVSSFLMSDHADTSEPILAVAKSQPV
jgi:predicted MFS family arabinose efflux permease